MVGWWLWVGTVAQVMLVVVEEAMGKVESLSVRALQEICYLKTIYIGHRMVMVFHP